MTSRILLRRGTAAQWASANPILGSGELGVETDTLKFKIGNGTSTWTQLTSYANTTPSDLTSAINGLINAAPSALDTLNELAAAINNDSSFSTTVNNLLNGKVSKSGGDIITAATASTTPLTIRGAASQTADLLVWQNNSGTTFGRISSNGVLINQFNYFQNVQSLGGGSGLYLDGSSTIAFNTAPSQVVFKVAGYASQTANLQEWQNSAGTALTKIDNNAGFYAQYIEAKNTAGVLVSGESQIKIASPDGLKDIRFWNRNDAGGLYYYNSSGGSKNILRIAHSTDPRIVTQTWQDFTSGSSANYGGRVNIDTSITTAIGMVIRGVASQTANLQEWQDSTGAVLANIMSNGSLFVNSTGTANDPITIQRASATRFKVDPYGNVFAGALTAGNTVNAIAGTTLGIYTATASNIGLIIRGAASQSANLQEWQNSSGTILSKIDVSGNITAPSYNLSDSKYLLRKTIKKTVDPAGNAIANNTYDLFDMSFSLSLQGTFYIQASIRGSGYGQNLTYSLPATYVMDWINLYPITNPFTNNTTWVDLTPLTFSPRHLMTNDYFKFQAKVNNNQISFRIKLTGTLTGSPLFDIYIQHSEEFANSTITELNTTGTDATTSNVMPNFLSSKAGLSAIFNPITLYSNSASNIPLTVKGFASQSANLQEWQNSSGTVLAKVAPTGALTAYSIRTQGSSPNSDPIDNTVYNLGVGPNASSYGISWFRVKPGSAGDIVSVFEGTTSQTGDLTQWRNSSGSILSKIDSSGAIYLINPTANNNSNDTPSPAINFQGNIWNSAYGNQNIKGAIKVAAYATNANPTISKMSFLLATDNGTPAEVASFTNTGAFSNIGGLDAYGSSVIFRLRNTTAPANSDTFTPSPKLELMGRGWNSNQGASPSRAYLQVNVNNTNSDPFINRLGFFIATGNDAGGYAYGADATEYMSILGNGTVGINTATPLGTLDIRPISASNKGIVIKGATSQTANLQEWQNDAGTILAAVSNIGTIRSNIFANITSGLTYIVTNYDTSGIGIVTSSAAQKGLIVRGAASQTANLQEWQDSAGTVKAFVRADGYMYSYQGFGGTIDAGQWIGGAVLTAKPYIASQVAEIIRGVTSQTADLTQWQNSAGTVMVKIAADGSQTWYNPSNSSTIASISPYGEIFAQGNMYVRSASNYGASLNVTTPTTSYIGAVIRGISGQSADLQQWQNSGGTVLAKVDASGSINAVGLSLNSTVSGVMFSIDPTYGNITSRNGAYGYSGSASLNVGTNYTAQPAIIASGYPGQSVSTIIIKSVTSQTSNLQEWQDSTGTVKSSINASGSLELNGKDIELMNIMGAF